MTTPTLIEARNIVRTLTLQEKLYLLNDLTAQLVQESTRNVAQQRPVFPVLHLDEWPNDVPQRRKELYDDRGR